MELEQLRAGLEQFTSEMELEEFLSISGQKKSETGAIMQKHTGLYSLQNILAVKSARKNVTGKEKKSLDFVFDELVGLHLRQPLAVLNDELNDLASRRIFPFEGEDLSLNQLQGVVGKEQDRERRKRIFVTRVEASKSFNPLRARILELAQTTAQQSLGYVNSYDLYSDARGIDYRGLVALVQPFLTKTEHVYRRMMNDFLLEHAGVNLDRAEIHDVAFSFGLPSYDEFFPQDKLISVLDKTFAGMGINVYDQGNVVIDLEDRPEKQRRTNFSYVKIPGDGRISVCPTTPIEDYKDGLHEYAHLGQCMFTSPTLPFEYRALGDKSVSEAYAFLFESLMRNPSWLKKVMKIKKPEELVQVNLMQELATTRYFAAIHQYEVELRQNGLDRMPDVFDQVVNGIMICKRPKEMFLEEVVRRDAFYMADYIMASMASSTLREYLTEQYGKNWFMKPRAGNLLKTLWSFGQQYTLEEVAGMLGYSISPQSMTEEFLEYLE